MAASVSAISIKELECWCVAFIDVTVTGSGFVISVKVTGPVCVISIAVAGSACGVISLTVPKWLGNCSIMASGCLVVGVGVSMRVWVLLRRLGKWECHSGLPCSWGS